LNPSHPAGLFTNGAFVRQSGAWHLYGTFMVCIRVLAFGFDLAGYSLSFFKQLRLDPAHAFVGRSVGAFLLSIHSVDHQRRVPRYYHARNLSPVVVPKLRSMTFNLS
jgi:hypothetical protein